MSGYRYNSSRQNSNYYTHYGNKIYNPRAYASTGAPMYKTKYSNSSNLNAPKSIYKLDLQKNKKYIGETKDLERRIYQHCVGEGSRVTQKYEPKRAQVIETCPGFFAKEIEQDITDEYIDKYGYENVRGGKYTNSKTF